MKDFLPESRKLQKGKSCFYFRKPEQFTNEVDELLKKVTKFIVQKKFFNLKFLAFQIYSFFASNSKIFNAQNSLKTQFKT